MVPRPRHHLPSSRCPAARPALPRAELLHRRRLPRREPHRHGKLVADPIEEKLNELDNIKRIRSDIDDGLLVVQVEFIYSESPDEIQRSRARGEQPATRPTRRPAQPRDPQVTASDVSTYQLAFVTDSAGYRALYDQADALKKGDREDPRGEGEAARLPRPATARLGGPRQDGPAPPLAQPRPRRDPERGQNIPGGSIGRGRQEVQHQDQRRLRLGRRSATPSVNAGDGRIVYLRDIATVEMAYNDETYLTRYNGKKAIFLTVSEKDRTNILEVQKKSPAHRRGGRPPARRHPAGAGLRPGRRRGPAPFALHPRLQHRHPARADHPPAARLRASLVVMISIPLSIAIGLFLLNLFGFTINQLSIVGMIIALGLLVDDSIVVVENIERFLRNGHKRRDAAIKATQQISLAVPRLHRHPSSSPSCRSSSCPKARAISSAASHGGGAHHHRLLLRLGHHRALPQQPRAERQSIRRRATSSCAGCSD